VTLAQVIINALEHIPSMNVLLAGRLMGGLSTALLFTAVESWMVTAHRAQDFPEELLANTFGLAATGNGLVAVFAGLIAQTLSDNLGEIGPFQAAIALTIVALIAIQFSWTENYGDQKKDASAEKEKSAMSLVLGDRKILLVGLVQAFFEGAMYTFGRVKISLCFRRVLILNWLHTVHLVFNWVPMLINTFPTGQNFSRTQGLIFSCFMVSVSIGGSVFSLLEKTIKIEKFSAYVYIVAALAMLVPVVRNCFNAHVAPHHNLPN
jgi:MFS family permease